MHFTVVLCTTHIWSKMLGMAESRINTNIVLLAFGKQYVYLAPRSSRGHNLSFTHFSLFALREGAFHMGLYSYMMA